MAIDLSSAYDLVDHDILIEKSRLMSVGKTCTNWLKNFLSKRSQFVELDGTKSQTIQCGSEGVVQGGPSSGELFVIFLNSLPIYSIPAVATSNMFVDDLSSVISGETEADLTKNVIEEFNRVQEYLIEHKMKINPSKTQLMFINPSLTQKSTPIPIEGSPIMHQDQMRILGLNLSSDLK